MSLRLWALFLLVTLFTASSGAGSTASHPPFHVCPGSGAAPVMLGSKLGFCGYTGLSCCGAVDDGKLRKQFEATMNDVSKDKACAAVVKDTLCTMKCSPVQLTDATRYGDNDEERAAGAAMARSSLLPHLLCGSRQSSSTTTSARRRRPNAHVMCLERISTGSFRHMTPHPDGSTQVFMTSPEGKIWLASVLVQGPLNIHDTFLDLTDRLHNDAVAFGIRGVAFHPEFSTNGRFFVAYTCDSASPACGAGDCWVDAAGNRLMPCRYKLVVDEFYAGGIDYYSKKPSQGRRIFSKSLPQSLSTYSHQNQNHLGQLFFRPTSDSTSNNILYLTTGQEILSFNVDHSTPKFEVYAVGITGPSGCSFDAERPSDMYCANVDLHRNELVHSISDNTTSHQTPVVSVVVDHGHPAYHRMPSLVGGHVYRGYADSWLEGKYLYMYGTSVWAAERTPAAGPRGNYYYKTAPIPDIRCSNSTPFACRAGTVIEGDVVSFGEDNSKDTFLLATGGVYRVGPPELCKSASVQVPAEPEPAASTWTAYVVLIVFVIAAWMLHQYCYAGRGGGGAAARTCCCNCNWDFSNSNCCNNCINCY